jgi:hypothetical protein
MRGGFPKSGAETARGNDPAHPEIASGDQFWSSCLEILALQRPKPKNPKAQSKPARAPEWGDHSPTYENRLKAAGLDRAAPRGDIDAFRNRLTRRINIFINTWRGCPEPICRRHRGCMAPNIVCANAAPPSEEEVARAWPRLQAEIYKALQARRAASDGEDG